MGGAMKFIITLLITLFVFIAGCSTEKNTSFSSADLKYLALLPQDARVVGAINFNRIRDAEIYKLFKKYADNTPFESQDYRMFVDRTGFNLETDLKNLYFAGTGLENVHQNRGLFIATGSFRPERITAFIESENKPPEKLSVETEGQYKVYRVPGENLTFCFPDSQTLIGGKDSLVNATLEKLTTANQLSNYLETALYPIRYKSDSWIWMNTEKFLASLPSSELGTRIKSLKAVRSGQMSVSVAEDIKFNGICTCNDEENAGNIKDMVKGAIAAAKLTYSDDREAINILNTINVTVRGNRVEVAFDMSYNDVEYLLRKKGLIASAF